LVHGIWANASNTWPPFEQWLQANYAYNLANWIWPADYGVYSYLAYSYPKTQAILEFAIADELSSAASQGVIARQVDVVAHSMGGLVTRYFLDNPPPYSLSYLPSNPVHKLITIGTPQVGSPLATTLWNNRTTVAIPADISPVVAALCSLLSSCTLGDLFARLDKPVSTGVQSLIPGNQVMGSQVYSSILGEAPESSFPPLPGSCTELLLDILLAAFLPSQTDYGILGGYPNDTIVQGSSQSAGAGQTSPVSGIVHTSLCGGYDTGETGSQVVWSQAAYWLMGGSGAAPTQNLSARPIRVPAASQSRAQANSPATALPVLDLTGYTQVPASNVSFSPASNSTLTINSATSITATSSTKTITEVLLFQTVSDPTDAALLYSTQSPFSIIFIPTRMGSTNFVAFAVFSDMTYAVTGLNYTFQVPGNPLALKIVNAPVASLQVGSSAIVGAQALFSSGPVM